MNLKSISSISFTIFSLILTSVNSSWADSQIEMEADLSTWRPSLLITGDAGGISMVHQTFLPHFRSQFLFKNSAGQVVAKAYQTRLIRTSIQVYDPDGLPIGSIQKKGATLHFYNARKDLIGTGLDRREIDIESPDGASLAKIRENASEQPNISIRYHSEEIPPILLMSLAAFKAKWQIRKESMKSFGRTSLLVTAELAYPLLVLFNSYQSSRRSDPRASSRHYVPPPPQNPGYIPPPAQNPQYVPPPAGPAFNDSCPICLEEFEEGEANTVTTVCRHRLHTSCFNSWRLGDPANGRRGNLTCPYCRADLR